jgi:hypothetical protein
MRSMIRYCLVCGTIALSGTPVALAAQDSTHMSDSVHHAKRRARVDTTTSNGSVSGTTNQDQSGVVNKHGASTLGPGVRKTTPTQGQAVTAKGDTLQAADSTHKHRRMKVRTTDSMQSPNPR